MLTTHRRRPSASPFSTKSRLQAYAEAHGVSLWNALDRVADIDSLTSGPRNSLRAFREMMAPFVARAHREPRSSWAPELVAESGFLQSVTRSHTREHLAREAQIEGLLRLLDAEATPPDALSAFLHRAWLTGSSQSHEDAATVAPADPARGLEYPVVFLAGLEEGLLPQRHSTSRDILLDEERNVFSVGLTRTQERLFLSWAQSRSGTASDEPSDRSRFLDELDASVLRVETGPQTGTETPAGHAPAPYEGLDPHYYCDNLRAQHGSSAPSPNPTAEDAERIREGLGVEHRKMGRGTVLRAEGEGEKPIAIVNFDERGRRRSSFDTRP